MKHHIKQRLQFINDQLSLGRFYRVDLQKAFEISYAQASIDLRMYREAYPGHIGYYDRKEKAYIALTGYERVRV